MIEKKKKYIIDVVPLTKIPLTTHQSFSYLSDEKISAGALVSISLFHRKVEGIVLRTRNDFKRLGNIELKKVEKIIQKNFLDEKQLQLAKFISNYYISSLGIVMKSFVPKKVESRKKKEERMSVKKAGKKYEKKKITLTKEQKDVILKISNTKYKKSNNEYLLFGPAGSGKTEVYIHSMLEMKKTLPAGRQENKNFQFLILLPEKTLTPQALERYGQYFKPKEIVVLSSNISKGQFYSNWEKIRSGEAKIIIGTRMAVFGPFKKLGLIVIDEEQDMSYKNWDMNPRYDARIVAEKLAQIHKCKIIRGSATPSIESYHRALNKDLKLLKLPALFLADSHLLKSGLLASVPTTIIVDMKHERWDNLPHRQARNYTCISKRLKNEIEYALKNKQQIILFINRQGMSNFSVCENCKTVLRCPRCDRALIYKKDGFYKCNYCNYKTGIFPKCAHCGGINFKNVGLGTQKVEKEVANLFPSARIIVADTATSRKKNFQEEIYKKFSYGSVDILIGTQMITKGWDLPRVSLVAIIDADNLLSFPDFFAQERAFQLISQLSGRVNRPNAHFPGTIIIQAYHPENEFIQLAAENNFQDFFEKIIKERKALSLPPFGIIIKLVFQDYNSKKVEKETSAIFKKINSISKIKISEPFTPLLPKIRGRFRKQMIIKIRDKIPVKLEKELKKLESGWIIDRDPISII